MRLPQYDQKLELWPGDCYVLSTLLARYVQQRVEQASVGGSLSRTEALSVKPATRLCLRLLRLHNVDAHMGRKKTRPVRVEYDELLVLNQAVRHGDYPGEWADKVQRLLGLVDQKSLSLTPFFSR